MARKTREGYIEGLEMLASMRLCAVPAQHAIQTALEEAANQSISEFSSSPADACMNNATAPKAYQ